MEQIKQTVKVPEGHEIRIRIPKHFPVNELADVILVRHRNKEQFKARINEMSKAKDDELFLKDLRSSMDDFKAADAEGM